MSSEPVEGIGGVKKVKFTSQQPEEKGTDNGKNPLDGFFSLLPASAGKVTGQEAYRQLLSQFFPGGAKPILKDGQLGFNVSGLTEGQRTQLKESLQGFLDQIYGQGVITVTDQGGVIGLDATNLSAQDVSSLAALLLGRTDPGQVTVSDKSRDAIRSDKGLVQISQDVGTTQPGSGLPGTGPVPVEAPAPGSGSLSPAQWSRLAALLSVETSDTMLQSNIETMDAMSQLQKDTIDQNIQQMTENFQKMAESAKKAATWGIFSKVVSYVSIAIGALLVMTGAGAGLGAMLIMGGVLGLMMQTEAGQKVMSDFVKWATPAITGFINGIIDIIPGISDADKAAAKASVKEWGETITTLVVTILIMVATMGAGAALAGNVALSMSMQVMIQVITSILPSVGDIYFGITQGVLTLQIGKGQEIQISLESFLTVLNQGYDTFSKQLSKIMDQMTSSISNATSVLQQEGTSATSYKFRTA
jgi:hypothetical protein